MRERGDTERVGNTERDRERERQRERERERGRIQNFITQGLRF